MDVNDTRFHLLLGYDDWANCSTTADGQQQLQQMWGKPASVDRSNGIAWDQTQSELTLQPYTFLITDSPLHTHPHLDTQHGAGWDRHGNIYWIDETEKTLLHTSPHASKPEHFWSAHDGISYGTQADTSNYAFQVGANRRGINHVPYKSHRLHLSGLTVTEDQYLLVGTQQPAGLLIFDLLAGGLPRQIFWPPTVPFAPFDMAPMPGGGACILDREHAHCWALDRSLNIIRDEQQDTTEQIATFQPVDNGELRHTTTQTFPNGISLQALSSIGEGMAVAIEALPDGTVLILVNDPAESFSQIYRYYFPKQLGTLVSTASICTLIEQEKQAQFHLNTLDFAFIPEHTDTNNQTLPDRLYILPQACNQIYAFNIQQEHDQLLLQPLPTYLPIRFFSGKRLVVADQYILYNSSDLWFPLLEQYRPRYSSSATIYTPLFTTDSAKRHAFDGKITGCVWHRLMLDASLPPETEVQIWSRATDDENELIMERWQREPGLLFRNDGSELPFVERPIGEGNGTWELLFQSARGRYLQLKIILLGNSRLTPRLRALRIYYPRFSYLEQYLPAVYREDSQAASFLDRFLANFEGIYTALEGKIASAQMLFDPQTVPSEALEWLASWLGLSLNLSWNTPKQRFFIKHAMDFFRQRGTINGLLMILHLTFDTRPGGPVEQNLTEYLAARSHAYAIRIVENFQTRYTPETTFDPDEQRHISRWQAFLARRYETIENLNHTYQSQYSNFAEVVPPTVLPANGPARLDWQQFATVVIPTYNSAHQFTVQLPLPEEGTAIDQQHQLELARHIIEQEKPVHTIFEIKFYQPGFCLGDVRLGVDTLLDLGNHARQILTPMVLGRGYLVDTYLADREAIDLSQRAFLKQ